MKDLPVLPTSQSIEGLGISGIGEGTKQANTSDSNQTVSFPELDLLPGQTIIDSDEGELLPQSLLAKPRKLKSVPSES